MREGAAMSGLSGGETDETRSSLLASEVGVVSQVLPPPIDVGFLYSEKAELSLVFN